MRIQLFLFLFFLHFSLQAQERGEESGAGALETEETEIPVQVRVGTTQYEGQKIPHIVYPTLPKYAPIKFKDEKEKQAYNRLVYNVKKVLPWAKLARLTIIETYEYLETLPTKEERETHMKRVEEGVKRQYGPALKKFSRSQGKLLVKLVNRECNQTGYAVTKAFLGPFRANFYQSIAFLFGNSLTKKYDPEGDDRYTERVVRMVEAGLL